jgi:PTS system mannose-specific IIC component
MGFVWGLITGDWASSLGICLFFELLWLDIFPAGTIIPPHSLAPALASLAVVNHFGLQQPSLAAVAMLAALPLGRAFAVIERYHRQYENLAFERLMLWARRGSCGPGPASLTRRSILVMLPVNAVAFALALSALLVVTHLLLPRLAPLIGQAPLKWPHLWVVASIGAVLSLRHRPAYAVLLGGVALAVLSRFLV